MPFRLSSAADRDLHALFVEGIEQFGEAQARRYLAELLASLERLADFPNMGRERNDIDPPVRAFPFRSHLIIYDIEEAGILIQRIRHGREDWIVTNAPRSSPAGAR